jgi:hypothetical protein
MSPSLEGRAGTTLGGRFLNENHHSGEGLSTGPRASRKRHGGVSSRLRRLIRCQARPDATQCSYDFKGVEQGHRVARDKVSPCGGGLKSCGAFAHSPIRISQAKFRPRCLVATSIYSNLSPIFRDAISRRLQQAHGVKAFFRNAKKIDVSMRLFFAYDST